MAKYEAIDTDKGTAIAEIDTGTVICSLHNISGRTRDHLAQLVVDAMNLQERFYMDGPVESTLQSEEFGHECFEQDDYLSALASVARQVEKVRAWQVEQVDGTDSVGRVVGIRVGDAGEDDWENVWA